MRPILVEEIPKIVNVIYNPNPISIPSHQRSLHENHWREQYNINPHLQNGDVFTITDVHHDPNELNILVSKTDYKHYLYTLHNITSDIFPCKVVYTCSSVITNDNYIVIGRMSDKTSTPNRLQFSGGGLNFSDIEGTRFNLERNIGKEILEEMGIDINSSYTKSFIPKYVKQKGSHDFWAVMFELRLELSSDELKNIFNEHINQIIINKEYPEFDKLIYVHLDKVEVHKFIKNDASPKVDYLIPILKYVDN
ncbi:MAG: hypothetical protein K0S34_1044 [Bacillales bacterium]|nr:hypothetical protein [Bacillales bacterium]